MTLENILQSQFIKPDRHQCKAYLRKTHKPKKTAQLRAGKSRNHLCNLKLDFSAFLTHYAF